MATNSKWVVYRMDNDGDWEYLNDYPTEKEARASLERCRKNNPKGVFCVEKCAM